MSLRVRKDGRMMCAAMTSPEPGDTYLDDTLHHEMCAVHRVIVTEPMDRHQHNAEWWWRNAVPDGVEIDDYYRENQT